MSITAGIVIIVVIAVRSILKNAPKIFSYALWVVVLFRLLCPVSVTLGFSLMGVLNVPVAENGRIEYLSFDADDPSPVIPASGSDEMAERPQDPGPVDVSLADGLSFPVDSIGILWICGAGALLIFNAVQLIRLRCKLVGAVPLQGNIYLADHITTPFVMGLIRPKIYLPSSMSETEKMYIIRHEKHHIRRGDHIIKLFAFAAVCIHWFNPLVWVAFVLAAKDMEMSCDEAVMRQIDRDIRADYALSLLQFSTGKRVVIGTPLAFGEGETKERIKNIMNYRKPTVLVVVLAFVMCLGLTACLFSDPEADTESSGLSEISIENIDLNADTEVGIELAYESEDLIIFYGSIGLFGYDLDKKEITFAVDFMKAVGIKGSIQGSRGTSVEVSADGKKIVISDYDAERNIRHKTCYIDIPTLTYTHAEYLPLQDVFDRDAAKGVIYPGVKTEQVKYILGDTEWSLFAE